MSFRKMLSCLVPYLIYQNLVRLSDTLQDSGIQGLYPRVLQLFQINLQFLSAYKSDTKMAKKDEALRNYKVRQFLAAPNQNKFRILAI